MNEQQLVETKCVKPGMDIVITKWIALEGTVKIAKVKETELTQRLPKLFVRNAQEFEQYISIEEEQKFIEKYKVAAWYPLSEGGVFGALWNFAEASKIGLEIRLRSIPVRQETIEICESFRINPYLLLSGGAVLMAAENGYDLVNQLQKEGIYGTVIGKAVDSNDRIILNEEEVRYLDRPQRDEWYKLL